MDILEQKEIKEWLDVVRAPNTRRSYISGTRRFFAWYKGTFQDFLALDVKQLRHLLLTYIAQSQGDNSNTAKGTVTAVNSFLFTLDKAVRFRRGEQPRIRPDLDSHIFTNGDLTKLFDVANTKEKALLATLTSTGWEISAVLELKRETIEKLLERARSEKQEFIYFPSVRKKTGVPRLGVLNPLCIEWLTKWLNESRDFKLRKRKPNKVTADRPISEIFDLCAEAANKMLRRLARHSGLVKTGRLHCHKIRGWVMSNLSHAGWNEFQIKYLIGKAIPMKDSTYLQTLEQEIEELYPTAYARFLNIKPEKLVQVIDEKKNQEIETLKENLADLSAMIFTLAGSRNPNMRDAVAKFMRDGDRQRLEAAAKEEGEG